VLVVGCEYAWVDDGPPRDVKTLVDGLGAEDTSSADFVCPFACLVEHERENVLVIGDGDAVVVSCVLDVTVVASIHLHALEHKLTLANDSGTPSAVVGMLPSDTTVLFVNTHDVRHL